MENWEKALTKFLKKYEKLPYFEGASLGGSYASGNQNAFSDIDVDILISDTQNWRERGNVEIDGFLIEYFMNPIKQIQNEFESDRPKGRTNAANRFAYGKIIKDVNGNVKKLKDEAAAYLKEPMPKYKRADFMFDLYIAWDFMDELNSLAREKKSLGLVYYKLLEHLTTLYCKANRIPILPLPKIEKIFTNLEYRKRYHFQKLPNEKFMELFLAALQKQNVGNMQKFYDYVTQSMGGFDIKTFKLRSEI